MKIEHLEERVADYNESIRIVVKKKNLWSTHTKNFIIQTLEKIVSQFDIGWRVQALDWMEANEAVNITFDTFPKSLLKETDQCPSYQFIAGGTLLFSQSYSGDIYVFISLPQGDGPSSASMIDLEFYAPELISEKLIVEKVDRFLKEMIAWEIPTAEKKQLGFKNED